jgi:hypothetical protein
MRTVSLLLRISLLALTAQTFVFAQASTASVDGVVLRVGTGEPLSKVLLELRSIDAGSPRVYSFITAADGRFTFSAVQPGRYQLTAMRQGYVRGDYGAHGPGASGIPITLPSLPALTGVRLTMTPTGTIAGRITSTEGEAIGNVHVKALRFSYVEGRLTLTDVKSVFTNDLGEYRLGWLPPGRYNVSARHPDGSIAPLNAPEVVNSATTWVNTAVTNAGGFNGGNFDYRSSPDPAARSRIGLAREEEYLPAYYPGTFDQRQASVIEVRPGSETNGIDLVLYPTRPGSISGSVSAAGPLPAIGNTGIPVSVSRLPTYNFARMTVRVDPRSGTFAVDGLAPGRYAISAAVGDGDERLAGYTMVDVSEGAQASAHVRLERGIPIPVRVTTEGAASAASLRAMQVNLRTDPLVPGMADSPGASSGADGMLVLRGVIPGDYLVNVLPMLSRGRAAPALTLPAVPGPPAPARAGGGADDAVNSVTSSTSRVYVKSMYMGDQDLLNGPLRVGAEPPTTPIEIVLASASGEINGAVVDSRGRPLRATVVAMPPENTRHRLDLYTPVMTDEAGRFRLSGLVPGDYRLYAWEDIESGSWLDETFMSTVQIPASYVRLAEGGRVATRLVGAER